MTGVHTYSTTASENVQANTGINWDEGMAPSAVNNSARANMADIRSRHNDLIWFRYGIGSKDVSATYVSATSFKLAGADVTAIYHSGRRVKAVGSSTGTIYGTITSSSFSTDTTVIVSWDSGSLSNETLTVYLSQVPVTGSPVPSAQFAKGQMRINGLSIANNASDATNDIDIATGRCRDIGDTDLLVLASALTKRLDASWAVGTNQGGLDTGSIANTTYHIWLIKRADTGVVDVLFSTSASSPTMPSNYTLKRRIGSIIRSGGAILAFKQNTDRFIWDVQAQDVVVADPGSSAVSAALTVPDGIVVEAFGTARLTDSTASTSTFALLTALDQTDSTPTVNLFDIFCWSNSGAKAWDSYAFQTKTNTSKQIRYHLSASDADRSFYINTKGYIDRRGQ